MDSKKKKRKKNYLSGGGKSTKGTREKKNREGKKNRKSRKNPVYRNPRPPAPRMPDAGLSVPDMWWRGAGWEGMGGNEKTGGRGGEQGLIYGLIDRLIKIYKIK